MSLLTVDSSRKLDQINQAVNETIHSGERATSHDRAHRYDERSSTVSDASGQRVMGAGRLRRVLEVGRAPATSPRSSRAAPNR